MNPAVLVRIGQRLIACIDDRTVVLNPLEKVVDDVVGALGDLERHNRSILRIPQPRPMQDEAPDLHPLVGITRASDAPPPR
jgi:hypothetical protein